MARRWRRRLLFGSGLVGALLLGPAPFNDAVFAQVADCENPPPGQLMPLTKTDNSDPVPAGGVLTYTLTLDPAGVTSNMTINDPIPAQTTFLSLTSPAGFTCITPAVGATAPPVNCNNPTYDADGIPDIFTLSVTVDPAATGTLSNSALMTRVFPQQTDVCFAAEVTSVGGAVPALSDLARWTLVVLLLAAGVLVVRRNRRPASRPPPPAAV